MNQNKTNKHFVSEIDQFLAEFDRKHAKPSASQQKEAIKHRQVYDLRDGTDRSMPAQKREEKF